MKVWQLLLLLLCPLALADLSPADIPALVYLDVEINYLNNAIPSETFRLYRNIYNNNGSNWIGAIRDIPPQQHLMVFVRGYDADNAVIYAGASVGDTLERSFSSLMVYSDQNLFTEDQLLPYVIGVQFSSFYETNPHYRAGKYIPLVINPHAVYCAIKAGLGDYNVFDLYQFSNATLSNIFSWILPMGDKVNLDCNARVYDGSYADLYIIDSVETLIVYNMTGTVMTYPFLYCDEGWGTETFGFNRENDFYCASSLSDNETNIDIQVKLENNWDEYPHDMVDAYLLMTTYLNLNYSGMHLVDFGIDVVFPMVVTSINVSPQIITLANVHSSISVSIDVAIPAFPVIGGFYNDTVSYTWKIANVYITGQPACDGIFNLVIETGLPGEILTFHMNAFNAYTLISSFATPGSVWQCYIEVIVYNEQGTAVTSDLVTIYFMNAYDTSVVDGKTIDYIRFPEDYIQGECSYPCPSFYGFGGYFQVLNAQTTTGEMQTLLQSNLNVGVMSEIKWSPLQVVGPTCVPSQVTCPSLHDQKPLIHLECIGCAQPFYYELEGPCFHTNASNPCQPAYGLFYSIYDGAQLDFAYLFDIYGDGPFQLHFVLTIEYATGNVTTSYTQYSQVSICFLFPCHKRNTYDRVPGLSKRSAPTNDQLFNVLRLDLSMRQAGVFVGFREDQIDIIEAYGSSYEDIHNYVMEVYPGIDPMVAYKVTNQLLPTEFFGAPVYELTCGLLAEYKHECCAPGTGEDEPTFLAPAYFFEACLYCFEQTLTEIPPSISNITSIDCDIMRGLSDTCIKQPLETVIPWSPWVEFRNACAACFAN